MPPTFVRRALAAGALVSLAACVSHNTARKWNGHVDANGKPVFLQTSTFWGCHFCVALPWFGKTTIDEMVDVSTAKIRPEDGSNLKVIETEFYNGWAAVPPFTFLFTPVMTVVTIEYQPTAEAIAAAAPGR